MVLGIKVARCIITVQINADIHVASERVTKHVQPSDRCYMECALDTTRRRTGAVQPVRSLPWTFYAKLDVERPSQSKRSIQTICGTGERETAGCSAWLVKEVTNIVGGARPRFQRRTSTRQIGTMHKRGPRCTCSVDSDATGCVAELQLYICEFDGCACDQVSGPV